MSDESVRPKRSAGGRPRLDHVKVGMRLSEDSVRKLDALRKLKGGRDQYGSGATYEPVIQYLTSLVPSDVWGR